MKRSLLNIRVSALLLLAAIPQLANAQQQLSFKDTVVSTPVLAKTFNAYNIVTISQDLTTLGDNTALTINYAGAHSFLLENSRILADNYRLRVAGENGTATVSLDEAGFDGRYFISQGASSSNACAFSTFDGQYYIYVRDNNVDFYIEPLTNYIPSASKALYVYYKPADVVTINAGCGTGAATSEGGNTPMSTQPSVPQGIVPVPLAGGCFTTELAMACDISMFTKYGSVNAVLHRTINVTNLTKTDYKMASGLTDNINFKIVEHIVVTCASCNPWTATVDINANLTNIKNNGPTLFANTYDLGQYWFANPNFASGTVGLAYIGAMCGAFRYNAILDFTWTYSTMRCTNSHEIAHNFNCQHDATAGFIVSPNVNGNVTTWSAASITAIGNYLPNLTCLAPCAATTSVCDTLGVNDLTVSTDSVNRTFKVKWTAAAGVSYKVRFYRYSNSTWSAWAPLAAGVDSNIYSLPAGACSGKYKAEVVPVCSGSINGGSKVIIFNFNSIYTPAITITAPTSTICAGTQVTFTATGTIIPGSSLQWKVDGVNVGTNSTTFSTAALTNGAAVTCVLTTNNSCIAPTVSSNAYTMTVSSGQASILAVSANPTTVCAGTASTLTASGMGNLVYTWSPNATLSNTTGSSVAATPSVSTTYTVVASDTVTGCSNSGQVTITVVTQGTWLGTTSSAWFTPANWCGNIPTITTNVVIPPTAPNMPVLDGVTTVNSFTNKGQMTIATGGVLNIY